MDQHFPSHRGQQPTTRICSPPTCLAAFVDERAQGLAHSGAEIWALTDGHAQGAGQPLESPQHICGVGAEARQQSPDLEGKGKGGRPQSLPKSLLPSLVPGIHYGRASRHCLLPATAVCHRSWPPHSSQPG